MRPLIYLMMLLCSITVIFSSAVLIRSCSNAAVTESKPQPVPERQSSNVSPNANEAVTPSPSNDATSPSAPAGGKSPIKTDQARDLSHAPQGEGEKPKSSDESHSIDGARERVRPILQAIALQADNKPLRASLISDIRRAGADAVSASMPELLNVLETDNDPHVQLVLISTMAKAPDAVPISALPLIKRIVQAETAQRELRDQGNFLIERLQARD